MDPLTNFPQRYEVFEAILPKWQEAVNLKHYGVSGFLHHPADQVRGTFGQKYARLDIGGSGAFMVDILDGFIYSIKGYGKVDKKKVIGNIYCPTFGASVLVRDRFRHGRFENNPDGSLRQTIVNRCTSK
jgi:hypothetical protein